MTEPDELEMAPLNAPNAVEHESRSSPGASFRWTSRDDIKSIEYYNRHTRVSHNTANGKTTFLFDYGEEGAAGRVNLEELLKLYDQAKLEVIRHPMVLNYINEILLGAATWYMFQLLTQYGYLFLLMAYCLTRAGLFTELLILYSFVYTLTTSFGILTRKMTSNLIFDLLPTASTLACLAYRHRPVYDEYQPKELALMPIIATLPIWIQIFITLKVSPVGTYIFMLRRIIFSFAKIMVIWILLIMMFALAFFIVMRELNVEPWANMGKLTHHSTFGDHIFLLAQIFIKASSMMIGELDTNHVLNTRKWEASILLLAFQIINAILFMNLLVSVSVGDVDDLKKDARDKLLKAKVAYAMEVAHSRSGFYQYLSKKNRFKSWFKIVTNNVLVVKRNGTYWTGMETEDSSAFAKNFRMTSSNQATPRANRRSEAPPPISVIPALQTPEEIVDPSHNFSDHDGIELILQIMRKLWMRCAQSLIGVNEVEFKDLLTAEYVRPAPMCPLCHK